MKRSLHRQEEIRLRRILKQQRLQQGLLQETLAHHLGKNRTFVSKYEQGETFLLFSEVVQLCRLLSLDIGQLASLIESYGEGEEADLLEAAEENNGLVARS